MVRILRSSKTRGVEKVTNFSPRAQFGKYKGQDIMTRNPHSPIYAYS